MYAEIVASGTELLMGETQDTDSSYLGARLPALGLELRQITLVGDDMERYVEVLERSWKRNPFTFTTGGLGPTVDDVTREAIAQVFGEQVYVDGQQRQVLIDLFKSRSTEMPVRNIKQAWLIPSARAIPNRMGTAPGWWAEKEGRVIVAMPGPPRELYEMWEGQVVPQIKERVKGSVVLTRTIKTIGLGEALVDEMATEVLGIQNPYVGTYAKPDGIYLRVIARGSTEGEAQALLAPVDEKLRRIFDKSVWGIDDETVEERVGTLLHQQGLTLATMESCTGGQLADLITNVAGSSRYYKGGIISYTNELKIASGVPAHLIETHGAVSEPVAAAMAQAARMRLNADLGVGITGVAGPEALEGKPPGTVFIGVADAKAAKASAYRFPANNRGLVKRRAVTSALLALRGHLTSAV
ncbi:MAG: competence/damage-inducible protein A [Chloroflexi bacterium]|nr:competence/damage-inducible protein A [Chloroflexota bacterium]